MFKLLWFLFFMPALYAQMPPYTPKVEEQSENSFGITWFRDRFTYQGPGEVFNKTFRSATADPAYLLIIKQHLIFHHWSIFHWGVGGSLGGGYNGGKGIFARQQTPSEVDLKLWIIPLDVSLVFGVSLGRFFSVLATGGPSVAGLIQYRSDFAAGEKGKSRRQIGYGYTYSLVGQLNLGFLFPERIYQSFRQYGMSKMMLEVVLRGQEYGHFKNKEVNITGTSMGFGLAFEFL